MSGASYLKAPFWRSLGPVEGSYRVGPLARLNAVDACGTPRADRALDRFRALATGPVLSTFHAHRARLVEIVYALERMDELLRDPVLLDPAVLTPAGTRSAEGVGACEAPRGTLFHRYAVDGDGLVTHADLLVASAQNATSMDRAVFQAAQPLAGRGPDHPGPDEPGRGGDPGLRSLPLLLDPRPWRAVGGDPDRGAGRAGARRGGLGPSRRT